MDQQRDNNTTAEDVTVAIQPVDLSSTSCRNLQQMNMHCLLEIFSRLDAMDLYSIACTCKRFQTIAQRIAPKDILIMGNRDHSLRGHYEVKFKFHRSRIEGIFKVFGLGLSTVNIKGRGDASEDIFLLNLPTNYSNGDNLKNLTIRNIDIPDIVCITLNSTFQQLQQLHLSRLRLPDDASVLAKLDLLVDLSVSWVRNYSVILENVFPQLESFTYQYPEAGEEDEQTLDTLSTFIVRHTKLKRLTLEDHDWSITGMAILQSIGNNCTELEGLELCVGVGSDFHPLHTLKSLRTLILRDASFENLQIFSSLTELRELTLFDCNLPKDCAQFAYWTQLNKLIIYRNFRTRGPINVVGIASRLTHLNVLKMSHDIMVDEKIFTDLLSIVRGRPNVLSLECAFNFEPKSYHENQGVKLSGYCYPID